MDYLKIEIEIHPFEEWVRDLLMAQLAETGFESFKETAAGMEGFIPAADFIEDNVEEVLAAFGEDRTFRMKKELIKSRNWNEVWEKNYFKPLVIKGECLVRAPFHKEYPHCKYEIVIEPNMAFGTGNHETTSMMLESILKEELNGKKVLDMGCGTGILGILASMKGAEEVMAIDIDDWSVKGTIENAAVNKINNLKVKKGNASLLGDQKYDLILANIHKNVLLEDLPAYSATLATGGEVFMSGFYLDDLKDLKKRAGESGLNFKSYSEKNSWTLGVFVKPAF